jgi:hypothetical protein
LALSLVGVIAILDWWLVSFLTMPPSPELLRNLAQIGATLLVAYGVEVGWAARSTRSRGARKQFWVGFVVGIGSAGLLGIVGSLVISERVADHWAQIDKLAFSWVVSSLGLLGILVVSLPSIVYAWSAEIQREAAIDVDPDDD